MDTRSLFQVVPLLLACLLASLGALVPAIVAGQAHVLRITLHDVDTQGLAGVVIVLRSEDDEELARALTDAAGTASFAELPAVVRVAVEGQPRSGPRLYQLGADAQGVRVQLGASDGPTVLDLRVERDGLILPDPATEVVREQGGPLGAEAPTFPTTLVATPSTAAIQPTHPAQAPAVSETPARTERQNHWVPWATVLVIAFAFGLLRLVQRRRDAR